MAAVNYYEGYTAYKDIKAAKKALKGMKDPVYRDAISIYDEANNKAKGYSLQERAAFFQQQARANNATFNKVVASNPSLGGVVAAAMSFQNVDSNNRFAANDASLQRSSAARLAEAIRMQANLKTNLEKYKLEQAGLALQDSKQRFANSWRSEENDIKQGFEVYSAMSGGRGSGTTYGGVPNRNAPTYDPYNPQPGTDYTDYTKSVRYY